MTPSEDRRKQERRGIWGCHRHGKPKCGICAIETYHGISRASEERPDRRATPYKGPINQPCSACSEVEIDRLEGLLTEAHGGLIRALDRAATPEGLAIKRDIRDALRRTGRPDGETTRRKADRRATEPADEANDCGRDELSPLYGEETKPAPAKPCSCSDAAWDKHCSIHGLQTQQNAAAPASTPEKCDRGHAEQEPGFELFTDLLNNASCSCGGWACPRCKITLDEVRDALQSLAERKRVEKHEL